MQVTKYQVTFFRYSSRRPVEDFIGQQSGNTQAKIHKCLDLLSLYGSRAGWPVVKKIDKSLFELRIRGEIEIRFIFITIGELVIVLHGFKKKTQKLPLRELRLAHKRLTKI